MCSVALALTGLTTGLQVAGQYQQSRAQAAAYEAQAQAAFQNARIQNKKGELMAEQYAQRHRDLDAKRRLVTGQQTAAAGAAGISGAVGSPLDVYTASMEAWGQDTVNLLNNQRNDEWNNYTGEVNYRNQGYAAEANAKAAKRAGNIGIAGTLLGAAASIYGMQGGGGSSSSAASGTGTASAPIAAGWRATALDTAMSGVSGYTPVTKGVYRGLTQTFGPRISAYNKNSVWNGVF